MRALFGYGAADDCSCFPTGIERFSRGGWSRKAVQAVRRISVDAGLRRAVAQRAQQHPQAPGGCGAPLHGAVTYGRMHSISTSLPRRIHPLSAVTAREPRCLASARHARSPSESPRLCVWVASSPPTTACSLSNVTYTSGRAPRICSIRGIATPSARIFPMNSAWLTVLMTQSADSRYRSYTTSPSRRCSDSSARLWGERAPRGVAGRVRQQP